MLPAGDSIPPGTSRPWVTLTHWLSPGAVNSGKPMLILPSSLGNPLLRTPTLTWNVCPMVIVAGDTATRERKTGRGSGGGSGVGLAPNFCHVKGGVRDRNQVSPTRPRLSVPPQVTSRSAPGSAIVVCSSRTPIGVPQGATRSHAPEEGEYVHASFSQVPVYPPTSQKRSRTASYVNVCPERAAGLGPPAGPSGVQAGDPESDSAHRSS